MAVRALGTSAICSVADAGTPSPFVAATLATDKQAWLVHLVPWKLDINTTPQIHVRAIGKYPICSLPGAALALAGLVDMLYSDAGLVTPSSGRFADTWCDGRVTQPLRLTWMLPVAPESARRVALDVAGLELINADGAMDSFIDNFDIGGRAVTVLFGRRDYQYEEFTPVFSGAGVSWARDFGHLTITVRDTGYRLEGPLQPDIYDGTGGADGTADLANKPKPVCMGIVRGIQPQMIDPANLIYQIHSRAIAGVDAVYDRRVALTAGSDCADYATLAASVPSAGYFNTCLAQGLIKLGAVAAGIVTADARGDAHGGYVETTAEIMQRLLQDFGGVTTDYVDSQAFSDFKTLVPGAIGWFQGSDRVISTADALSELAAHCAAWWGTSPDGRFTVGRIDAPSTDAVTDDFQEYDIIDIRITNPLVDTDPPRWRQRVGYCRNWTVMRPSDIAASVSQEDVLTAAQPYRVTTAINSTTQANYLLAQDSPVLESLFDAKADADALAERLVTLLGVQRQTMDVTMNMTALRLMRGACVAITSRRINGGHRFIGRYVGNECDAAAGRNIITLWG